MDNSIDPLDMLTAEEVAEKIKISIDRVKSMREVGLIRAIKTGKNFMYPRFELERFEHEYLGYDISNVAKMSEAYLMVEKAKADLDESAIAKFEQDYYRAKGGI